MENFNWCNRDPLMCKHFREILNGLWALVCYFICSLVANVKGLCSLWWRIFFNFLDYFWKKSQKLTNFFHSNFDTPLKKFDYASAFSLTTLNKYHVLDALKLIKLIQKFNLMIILKFTGYKNVIRQKKKDDRKARSYHHLIRTHVKMSKIRVL